MAGINRLLSSALQKQIDQDNVNSTESFWGAPQDTANKTEKVAKESLSFDSPPKQSSRFKRPLSSSSDDESESPLIKKAKTDQGATSRCKGPSSPSDEENDSDGNDFGIGGSNLFGFGKRRSSQVNSSRFRLFSTTSSIQSSSSSSSPDNDYECKTPDHQDNTSAEKGKGDQIAEYLQKMFEKEQSQGGGNDGFTTPPTTPPRTPFSGSPVLGSKKCPSAPVKKTISQSVVKSNYYQIEEKLKRGSIEWNGVNYKVKKKSAEGQFKIVYELAPNEKSFWETEKNEKILIKAYNFDKRKFSLKDLEDYTESAIIQQDLLEKENLPISKILNDPLEDGFFVVENVPFAIEDNISVDWGFSGSGKAKKVGELSPQSQKLLFQAREFFRFGVKNKEPLDWQMRNFRLRENKGQFDLVLIDYTEMREEELEDVSTGAYTFLKQGFKGENGWVQGNEHVFDFFMEGIKDLIQEKSLQDFFSRNKQSVVDLW